VCAAVLPIKWAFGLGVLLSPAVAAAQLLSHDAVVGADVARVNLGDDDEPVDWISLSKRQAKGPATQLRFLVPKGTRAAEIPYCANLLSVTVDGAEAVRAASPFVIDVAEDRAHTIVLRLATKGYERRVACSYGPRLGTRTKTTDGLGVLAFSSAYEREGGGHAVVYIPKGHDMTKPSPLLVGLHPWNGSIWTYAAYAELLREADARDVVLLMPSGLGNSLYTEPAEKEVLAAIDELARAVTIDSLRVSIWGASMGGAGATTIGFHHPDRFATITSFFGDSKYDLRTYVRAILRDEQAAHQVNALDIADNARNVPVWLIHGEDDRASPIAQSEVLAQALRQRGFSVRFDRVPGVGHQGSLVARLIARVVDRAAEARAPEAPRRVSFVSVRPGDTSAYALRMTRTSASGDAAIDLEREGDVVHVRRAHAVRAIALPRGAFGAPPSRALEIVVDDPTARRVDVHWDPLP
jgi:pimeloyl-ACP methyl ester carboxylesterase